MKKYAFLVFVLIAVLLSINWKWTNTGRTWNRRPIQSPEANDTSSSFIPYTSDSDTVLTTRTAQREIDSIFVIGGVENCIKIELWFCGYGDSSMCRVLWNYGNHRYNLLQETLFDTSLATAETVHVLLEALCKYDVRVDTLYVLPPDTLYFHDYLSRHNYAKWGSITFQDSIDPTAGDSTKYWIVEYDQ